MSRRPPATLADYLLVGINPALIMVLIGSLVFFLLAVFYRGVFDLRLNFIFAMFIMGAVAVGRISMEEGSSYATMFGAPLALVTLIALNRFVQVPGVPGGVSLIVNSGLIALIWWLAYQLTWDCTLLDERADTSDQGLLEVVGVPEGPPAGNNLTTDDTLDPRFGESTSETQDETPPWINWLKRSKKPHAHGVWVIYFSMAALPLFGLGQWFLPADARQYAFFLLVVYVATALALLLSTSFLGLRRYLRKRRLEMPLEMTATWLGVGGVLIAVVLALCLLLPRPGAEVAISQLPITITTPDLSPSRWNMGNDGQKNDSNARASGKGKKEESEQTADDNQQTQSHSTPGGEKGSSQGENGNGQPKDDEKAKQSGGSKSGEQSSGGKQKSSQQGEKSQAGGKQGEKSQQQESSSDSQQASSGEKSNDQASQSQPPNQQQATSQPQATSPPPSQPTTSPQPPSPAPLLSSLGSLVKLLLYAIVLGLIAFFAWKYRRELLAAWQQLLKELRELLERLFGGKASETVAAEQSAAAKLPVRRPFAAFTDPFAAGQAARMNRLELLRYSFEALQAWGREHGCPRQESETPHEYASRLAMSSPHLAREAAALAEFYGIAAYGGGMLPATIADPLRALWVKMSSSARQVPVG